MRYLFRLYLGAAIAGALAGCFVWWVSQSKTDRYCEEELP